MTIDHSEERWEYLLPPNYMLIGVIFTLLVFALIMVSNGQ
jgi:hypothetical protein